MADSRPYLPAWATLQEAQEWLEELTASRWPLPRILGAVPVPSLWLDARGAPPAVFDRVFGGRAEGYLAPLIFSGDLNRLKIDRTGLFVALNHHPGLKLWVS